MKSFWRCFQRILSRKRNCSATVLLCFVVVLHLCFLTYAVDFETVCSTALKTARLWGPRVSQYTPNCKDFLRGLSPKILEVGNLMPNYSYITNSPSCYQPLTRPLCAVQFEEYAASPTCPESRELFFDLVRTCMQETLLSSEAASCPSFNKATQLIDDPLLFCSNAYLREDGPENSSTGLPESFEMKRFSSAQYPDCQQNVMTYNACRQLGVDFLGYPIEYCLGTGGLNAFCKESVSVIKDPDFVLTCENVVVPALAEYFMKNLGSSAIGSASGESSLSVCSHVFQKWLTFLAARKGDAFLKIIESMIEGLKARSCKTLGIVDSHSLSREAYQKLQSNSRPLLLANELKLPIKTAQSLEETYFKNVQSLLAILQPYVVSAEEIEKLETAGRSLPLAMDYLQLATAINETGRLSYSMESPQASSGQDVVNFGEIRAFHDAMKRCSAAETHVMKLGSILQKKLVAYVGQATEMPLQPYQGTPVEEVPISNGIAAGSYGFPQPPLLLTESQLTALNRVLRETCERNNSIRRAYDELLNQWAAQYKTNDLTLINKGVHQIRLAYLRDAQIRLLLSLYKKVDAADVIREAMLARG